MGNSASSSSSSSSSSSASAANSCSELDLRYKSTLVNHNYGSMYIQNNRSATMTTIATSTKYHSNLNLNSNPKKSKINKIFKFLKSPQKNSLKVEKRDENKVKNRRQSTKNFITKSLVFFRTPLSQKDKSPNMSLKCSTTTPLDFTVHMDMGPKSASMYAEHDDLSSKLKRQLSLKSDKSSCKLNSSPDSKNDSGILSDYKRNEQDKLHMPKVKSSMSTFSIRPNQSSSSSITATATAAASASTTSNNNRRLSINSSIVDNQMKNNVNIRRTSTFHTTKLDSATTASIAANLTATNTTTSIGEREKEREREREREREKEREREREREGATTAVATFLNIPREVQPLPTRKENVKSQKVVVQASTSELLRCLTSYLLSKYPYLIKADNEPLTSSNRLKADSREVISWLRSADRALLLQGWQEIAFMNPVNVVFVYLLIRDSVDRPKTVYELQCHVMSCLYLAFSYMGNEISYPLKPFLVEDERDIFWQRIVSLMNLLSSNMLRINQDARFFTELFYELKSYAIQSSATVCHRSTIQKSITLNSFRSYDRQFQSNNSGRVSCSKKPLVFSNHQCSKFALKSPAHLNHNTQRESCLYPVNDAPLLFKPLAYCI